MRVTYRDILVSPILAATIAIHMWSLMQDASTSTMELVFVTLLHTGLVATFVFIIWIRPTVVKAVDELYPHPPGSDSEEEDNQQGKKIPEKKEASRKKKKTKNGNDQVVRHTMTLRSRKSQD